MLRFVITGSGRDLVPPFSFWDDAAISEMVGSFWAETSKTGIDGGSDTLIAGAAGCGGGVGEADSCLRLSRFRGD